MRYLAPGLILLASLTVTTSQWLGTGPSNVPADDLARIKNAVANGDLIALTSDVAGEAQMVTVIDTRQRVMSVYHLDRATGAITLKSVREIRWDLQMEEFNGGAPSPREIRSLLQQR